MSKLFREKIYKKVRILRILYIVSTPAIYDQIIASDETGWMSAHEYIDQKNLDDLLARSQQPPISLFKKIISFLKSY